MSSYPTGHKVGCCTNNCMRSEIIEKTVCTMTGYNSIKAKLAQIIKQFFFNIGWKHQITVAAV